MSGEIQNRLNQMTEAELRQSLKTLENWDAMGYCTYSQLERIEAIKTLLKEQK